MTEASRLERLLRREQALVAAGLAALCLLTWYHLIAGAGLGASSGTTTNVALFPHRVPEPADAMSMPMSGMAAWTLSQWALVVAMWWSMMVAMMTPSAAPTILLYARVRRHALGTGQAAGLVPTAAFTLSYLLAWLAISVAAATLHWWLEQAGLLSMATMGSRSRWLSGGLLIAAGLYQLSPLKNACLAQCRAPAVFLSRHWRPGAAGALRLGARHGAYCVGCCWLLMTLLFVGGVMNLAWIAALTLLVMAEKLLPFGEWLGRAAAGLLVVWGVATLALAP